MKKLLLALGLLSLFAVGQAEAGGEYISGAKGTGYCRAVEQANVLISYDDRRALKEEVWRRYEHALAVSIEPKTNYSTSPLFLWSNEAKIECAKAYGFLRKRKEWHSVRSDEMLQRCDCFYERMLQYTYR